jgi:hypothetical protein
MADPWQYNRVVFDANDAVQSEVIMASLPLESGKANRAALDPSARAVERSEGSVKIAEGYLIGTLRV